MAGLKFYLCQTEDGPQLEHLQIEAKKRDPDYETIEIDTSKAALMERLNDLMRRAHAAESASQREPVSPSPAPAPQPPASKDDRLTRLYDQTGFEQFVWDIPDDEAHRLDVLEECIKERRREISGEKRQPAPSPAPVPRKQWGKK